MLTASSLVRKKALVPGARTAGSWGWTYDGDDEPHATIGYDANLTDSDNAWLRLQYQTERRTVGLPGPAARQSWHRLNKLLGQMPPANTQTLLKSRKSR